MNKKRKIILISSVSIIIILIVLLGIIWKINKQTKNLEQGIQKEIKLKELPLPEITGGQRGELGIDKNINEATIDEYLNRPDSVYRDMRMLEDPGNYENIGGDRFLSGYIEGFEVIPLPYIIPVTGLPSEVGDTYTGTTLFYENNGTYIANYEQSMKIIEKVFPKDKVIFLMCGGGGYAGMTKKFLVSMGWNENKIYNIGGYWYYKGKHNVTVKKEINGEVKYDFDKVPYHKIEFEKLTKSANYKAPTIKVKELKINTSELELEEGTSFQLDVIVLPNDSTDKTLKWKSDDESVAMVTEDGLVKAIGEGSATITCESADGKITTSCKVNVTKKVISTRIKLDDISAEIEELSRYNLRKVDDDFLNLIHESQGKLKEEYVEFSQEQNRMVTNDLWKEEYDKKEEKLKQTKQMRADIFKRMLEQEKSFIILIHNKACEERDYSVFEGAMKILNENNYEYLTVGTPVTDGDEILTRSNIEARAYKGSLAIIKNGELYANIDPDIDSIKDEEELKNWLSKYIDI